MYTLYTALIKQEAEERKIIRFASHDDHTRQGNNAVVLAAFATGIVL